MLNTELSISIELLFFRSILKNPEYSVGLCHSQGRYLHHNLDNVVYYMQSSYA